MEPKTRTLHEAWIEFDRHLKSLPREAASTELDRLVEALKTIDAASSELQDFLRSFLETAVLARQQELAEIREAIRSKLGGA